MRNKTSPQLEQWLHAVPHKNLNHLERWLHALRHKNLNPARAVITGRASQKPHPR